MRQVWKYEGSKTLSYYLRRRDTTRALSQDLQVPEAAVVPTVMKHIFEGLSVSRTCSHGCCVLWAGARPGAVATCLALP